MTVSLLTEVDAQDRAGSTACAADEQSPEPSILAITSELPWPLNTGGHIRTYHLLRSLARRFRLRLIAPVESEEDADEGIRQLAECGVEVRPAIAGRRTLWGEAIRVMSSALRAQPYVLYRRHDRRAVQRVLRKELERDAPHVLYLDHLDPLAYQPLFPDVPAIMDVHNVYSRLARRVSEERDSWYTRLYLRREARLLAAMERRAAWMTDAMMAVSEPEQAEFHSLGARSVHFVPNGVDCSIYAHLPVGRQGNPPRILYLGAMSWQPNVNAAVFLARQALPALRKHIPDAVLQIVGRDPVAEVKQLATLPGVELAANVPDVSVYLRDSHVLAVPLDSGGGTRLKILEAFAAGLPVVSTAVGCEGIEANDGEHLAIAPRERFADQLRDLLKNPESATRMATRARSLAQEKYDWNAIGQRAVAAVDSLLQARSQS